MGAPGDLRSPGVWRQAGARTKGLRGFDPPRATDLWRPGRHPVPKHGSGVLIKIPSSILIGWGLPNVHRTMRTGSAQAYGSGPTANQIARISWMETTNLGLSPAIFVDLFSLSR